LTNALQRKRETQGAGALESRLLSAGDGWRVLDTVCTAGPRDHAFAERHAWNSVSLVVSGLFALRGSRGTSLLAPGSLMLGNAREDFECSHWHGEGDRCISFQFEPELFGQLLGVFGAVKGFESDSVPPLRPLASVTMRAIFALSGHDSLEEIAIELASSVLRLNGQERPAPAKEIACVARALGELEHNYANPLTLTDLAAMAGVSRFHFLRTFKRVTGVTPHQWMLRARLREAARRLGHDDASITEIAYDAGFEDLSNFIRTFRAEFRCSPRAYRSATRHKPHFVRSALLDTDDLS
jgi:AraC family transcriptional regulator